LTDLPKFKIPFVEIDKKKLVLRDKDDNLLHLPPEEDDSEPENDELTLAP